MDAPEGHQQPQATSTSATLLEEAALQEHDPSDVQAPAITASRAEVDEPVQAQRVHAKNEQIQEEAASP